MFIVRHGVKYTFEVQFKLSGADEVFFGGQSVILREKRRTCISIQIRIKRRKKERERWI